MTGRRRALPWGRRVRSCAVLFAVAALSLALACAIPAVEGSLALGGVLSRSVASGGAGPDALPSLPAGFAETLFELPEHSDLRVDEEAGVVGYSTDQSCGQAFSAVDGLLCSNGWERVGSGIANAAGYSKDGMFVFVSCVGVGKGSSVVVQAPYLASAGSSAG